ncbi:hypothetical protein, partial [Marinomonas aquimarina]|uniref:hypothetical protein n=1 Tax=Marinomonas aquimarina TaxID=295068 RepID=UPI001E3FF711
VFEKSPASAHTNYLIIYFKERLTRCALRCCEALSVSVGAYNTHQNFQRKHFLKYFKKNGIFFRKHTKLIVYQPKSSIYRSINRQLLFKTNLYEGC